LTSFVLAAGPVLPLLQTEGKLVDLLSSQLHFSP